MRTDDWHEVTTDSENPQIGAAISLFHFAEKNKKNRKELSCCLAGRIAFFVFFRFFRLSIGWINKTELGGQICGFSESVVMKALERVEQIIDAGPASA